MLKSILARRRYRLSILLVLALIYLLAISLTYTLTKPEPMPTKVPINNSLAAYQNLSKEIKYEASYPAKPTSKNIQELNNYLEQLKKEQAEFEVYADKFKAESAKVELAGKASYANYKANYKQGYKYEVIKDYDLYLARNRDELALRGYEKVGL